MKIEKWGHRFLIAIASFFVASFLSMFFVLTVGIVQNSESANMPMGYQIAFYTSWAVLGSAFTVIANRELEKR